MWVLCNSLTKRSSQYIRSNSQNYRLYATGRNKEKTHRSEIDSLVIINIQSLMMSVSKSNSVYISLIISKSGVPLCRKSWLKSWLKSAWNKLLFQCNRFHCADFRHWNRDWIFQNDQCSFWKILTEIGKKINHRTNTAIFYVTGSTVQKFGRAAQADFFRKWVELMNIYIVRVLCMT